ncbi:vacuolar iron transporter homolog 4-like [Solanum dulcamara]|uniref:vacuolar iron transporter homolog 4-like n=1 Tax=Solanum dulcamara TaxID=45834 RepID=UPI002484E224|nr:vacuolar iron transporter homolog 4-like [Solanum dulcamara]
MDSSQSIEACAKKEPHATAQEEKTSKKLARAQWLRAAILGANDGLLSTTSLMLGVGAAKDQDQRSMVLSGVAGALAGACSMAVGEFVSVSTQRDIAKSISYELKGSSPTNIAETKEGEVPHDMSFHSILATSTLGGKLLYESPVHIQSNSLTPARSPMTKIMEIDARRTMMEESKEGNDRKLEPLPSPLKAAAASSTAFLFGAFVPMVPVLVVSENRIRIFVTVIVASLALCLFGGIGAYLGGASVKISAMRVLLGGWISMAITYGLLKPFDNDD